MTTLANKREKKTTQFIPRSKDPRLKLYSPDDIMKAGGIAAFSKLIGNDKPIKLIPIKFTEDEWEEMLKNGID